MTAGSDGANPGNTTGAGASTQPSLDVVGAALKQMFADVPDEPITGQADLAAVDDLVVAAINARRDKQHDAMVSLIAAISDDHGRDGVSHAISVLCGIAEELARGEGQPDNEVAFKANPHPELSEDQGDVLVRSARLASDLLAATRTHDGPRLAEALQRMSTDTFDAVLTILVSHAAEILTSTGDVRAHMVSAPDRLLCPTTQA